MSDSHAASPSRTVHCEDAISWLERQATLPGCSLITSLPDFSEFPRFTLEQWKDWFRNAARLVLSRCPSDGIAIFYQTDLKKAGQWVDKGFLCQQAAEQASSALLSHKIVCRAPAGAITHGRPAYSHLLAFSREIRMDLARSTADVLPEAGAVTWTRGMGTRAGLAALKLVRQHAPATRVIVDPFCGHGTVLAVANHAGLDAVGVELSAKRARRARTLGFAELEANSATPLATES